MLVHASSGYTCDDCGWILAYCERCDAVVEQRLQRLRRVTRVYGLFPVLSLRAGVLLQCNCGSQRCGDARCLTNVDSRCHQAIHPSSQSDSVLDEERVLCGLASRLSSNSARSDDRVFAIKQAMLSYWQRRVSKEAEIHISRDLLPLFIPWSMCPPLARRLETEAEPVIKVAEQVGAQREDLELAYLTMRGCRFWFMAPVKPRRVWAFMQARADVRGRHHR